MRDIIVTLLVFGSLPFIFRHAYVGILMWSWVSYMNPHRLAWGFAQSMPFAAIIAGCLFLSFLACKERQTVPLNATTFVWVLFVLWMGITTLNAVYPDRALEMYIQILKIQVVTFMTIMLMTDARKLNLLIWVIVGSIGFFSVKGGIFTIVTGGAFRVYGPPYTNISENNALAVAILMIVPLMFYLRKVTPNIWVKRGMLLAIVLSLAAALGSQSRGALITLVAVGGFFWLKSKGKLITGALMLVAITVFIPLMPESWHERMDTITNYEQDVSAMQRINSWQYSMNIADDRFTGGGLQSWSKETFAVYAPYPQWVYVAHSIYFSIIADHGWPGLVMFLLILALTWRNLSQTIKRTHHDSDANMLARMLQVSLIAYMSGGAFLSLSYFDLPWHIIAIAVLMSARLETLWPEEASHRAAPETNTALSRPKFGTGNAPRPL